MNTLPWRSGVVVFLVAATVTSVFLINLCALVFDCGCGSWWSGAANHCNMHDPEMRHCPWCSYGDTGFALVFLGIVAPQGLLSVWPRRQHWSLRLGSALLAFPAAGALIGLAMGWWTGYWG